VYAQFPPKSLECELDAQWLRHHRVRIPFFFVWGPLFFSFCVWAPTQNGKKSGCGHETRHETSHHVGQYHPYILHVYLWADYLWADENKWATPRFRVGPLRWPIKHLTNPDILASEFGRIQSGLECSPEFGPERGRGDTPIGFCLLYLPYLLWLNQ